MSDKAHENFRKKIMNSIQSSPLYKGERGWPKDIILEHQRIHLHVPKQIKK